MTGIQFRPVKYKEDQRYDQIKIVFILVIEAIKRIRNTWTKLSKAKEEKIEMTILIKMAK